MLKISDKALLHAKKTLKITKDHDLKDFDLAYAYEAMARACSISENAMESKKWFKKTTEAGNLIANQEDKKCFILDLNAGHK